MPPFLLDWSKTAENTTVILQNRKKHVIKTDGWG